MSTHTRWLILIVILTAFCIWVALPDTTGFEIDLNNDGVPEFSLNVQQSLGLDLVGGLRVLLQAELPPDAYTLDDLRETANNVGRRVDALGLSEATVQTQGSSRILVELPGVTDQAQAIEVIQQTALLEFVDFGSLRSDQVPGYTNQRILTTEQLRLLNIDLESGLPLAEMLAGTDYADRLRQPVTGDAFVTVMTGAGLQSAVARFGAIDPVRPPQWFIEFEIKPEFQQIFGAFTGSRIGQPMAIVLDGEVLSSPVIQSVLSEGGIITGTFTETEATTLALQLRSGALPIPLRVESAEEVGATLGQESVNRSVRAGLIGVFVVLTFMLVYYRLPGVAADLALIVFILLNLALFKLIPITLTLPAITGFLIGIGTAVDGNILIFERIKEELRAGRPLGEALEAGFDRAWTSIRDSNLSTILISGVLFLFGQTPGASAVSGFAITLALGLMLNLFTAVIVTRTFLHLFVGVAYEALARRKWLLGVQGVR